LSKKRHEYSTKLAQMLNARSVIKHTIFFWEINLIFFCRFRCLLLNSTPKKRSMIQGIFHPSL
jgi:hypothetical protein